MTTEMQKELGATILEEINKDSLNAQVTYVKNLNRIQELINFMIGNPFVAPSVFTVNGVKTAGLEATLSSIGPDWYKDHMSLDSLDYYLVKISNEIDRYASLFKHDNGYLQEDRIKTLLSLSQPYEVVSVKEAIETLTIETAFTNFLHIQELAISALTRKTVTNFPSSPFANFNPRKSFEENSLFLIFHIKNFLLGIIEVINCFISDSKTEAFQVEFENTFS